MKNLYFLIVICTFLTIALGHNFVFADFSPNTNGTQFQLKANQTYFLESDGIKIQFLNVTADSRCPSDVTCIWEGEAKVLVNVIENNQDLGNFTLTSRGGQPDLAVQAFDGHTIQVVNVEPYPISTKKLTLSDYSVTFAISRSAIFSPLKQLRSGVPLDEIDCSQGLYLAVKSDHQPLCLKASTITKLASRGFLYGTQSGDTSHVTIVIPPGSENPASNKTYSPDIATVVIGINNTVRWVNQADIGNTVASDMPITQDGKNFDRLLLQPSQYYEFTFTDPGTYTFHGEPHPWQIGTVVVIGENATLPSNEIALKEGQREGPLQVETILPDSVIGLNYIEYPLARLNGNPVTLHIGDSVSNGCTESLTLVKIGSGIAYFTKKTDYNRPCPVCLSGSTLISTPDGQVDVKNLNVGMKVWSQDEFGHKTIATILQTGKTPVAPTHQMVHITLDDGRKLIASQGHPTTDGRYLGDLKVGDLLDGSKIIRIVLTNYDENYTYDILPSGPTGSYWADGILLKSTLK